MKTTATASKACACSPNSSGKKVLAGPTLKPKVYEADLKKYLDKKLSAEEMPEIFSVIVFTHPKVSVQAQDAPIPTMHVDKLKDYLRRRMKERPGQHENILP
jgi:hypothetical protein